LEWSEADQEDAIEWQLERTHRCPGCGTYPEEWMDDRGIPKNPPPYVIDDKRCYGCLTIQEHKSREDVKNDTAGLLVGLKVNREDEDE
jgi:hypothetical protein